MVLALLLLGQVLTGGCTRLGLGSRRGFPSLAGVVGQIVFGRIRAGLAVGRGRALLSVRTRLVVDECRGIGVSGRIGSTIITGRGVDSPTTLAWIGLLRLLNTVFLFDGMIGIGVVGVELRVLPGGDGTLRVRASSRSGATLARIAGNAADEFHVALLGDGLICAGVAVCAKVSVGSELVWLGGREGVALWSIRVGGWRTIGRNVFNGRSEMAVWLGELRSCVVGRAVGDWHVHGVGGTAFM